jgi:hypothetical protein
MTMESVDIADLHVICGAIENRAEVLCTSDRRTLGYDPIGSLRVLPPDVLAAELSLIDVSASSADVAGASTS